MRTYLGISRRLQSSLVPPRSFALPALLALSLPWSVLGCAATPKQVVNIARADLACPSAEVTQIGGDRYGASGCGRGAVYTRLCDDAGCRWGRLRHGHETAIAGQLQPASAAPAPEEREVLAAPAPATREIIPAPPPGGADAPPLVAPVAAPDASAAPATPTAPGAPGAALAPAATPTPVPLSEGELSAPYDATVPERPQPQQTAYAPPQPLVDDRSPPPAPYYQWVGGYWSWGASGWVWLPGYWCAPVMGYSYMPGYWYWSSSYWWYWPGGWARPGTRTIVVQTAPRPQRIVRVRGFTPRSGGGTSGRASVASAAPAHGVGRASPMTGFRPASSPLLHYPSPVNRAASGGIARSTNIGRPIGSAGGGASVGHVVRPGAIGARPSRFATSRPSSGPSPAVRRAITPGFSRPSSGARFIAPRSSFGPARGGPSMAPARSSPSIGRAHRR